MRMRQLCLAVSALFPVSGVAAVAPLAAPAAGPSLGPDPSSASAMLSFDPTFVYGSNESVDLSRFEHGNITLPGKYRVQILVNGDIASTEEIVFKTIDGSETAYPCLDRKLLVRLGLDPEKLAQHGSSAQPLTEQPVCGGLDRYIPGARVDFDPGEQQLSLSIPQIFLNTRARGYISPEYWDEGATVGMLGYNTNTYRVSRRGYNDTSTYVGLNAGLNVSGWRLRHQGALNLGGGRHTYQNSLTYAQHDLTDARAQMTLGDSYTSGELLDSVRIRGVSIASDQRMLPTSQRGYAPVIRGVAETNAKVTVKQRGYIVYETTVAPGPFVIDDLYPSGYSGDLDVVITEADGRQKVIRVPFAAQPRLLREGNTRFSVAAGQVSEQSLPGTPFVFQGTLQHGLSNSTTLYGGATASNSYFSGMLGAAFNAPFGALSLDISGARTALRTGGIDRGLSTRLSYAKNIDATGTNFGVSAYRFSTRGYHNVLDAARLRYDLHHGKDDTILRERNRFDLNISQPLGRSGGQLLLQGSLANYWNTPGRRLDFTLGYGNSFKKLNYNLSLQRSRLLNQYGPAFTGPSEPARKYDTTAFVSFSIPLGSQARAPLFTSTTTRTMGGGTSSQAGLSGQLGADNNFNYGVSATRSSSDQWSSSSGNANASYRGSAGTVSGSVGAGGGSNQYSFGVAGAVVAHDHGVTLSQELGETNAIVHAEGAAGAAVENYTGLRLDKHGNAVVPSLSPYQLNTVSIDPNGSSADVELDSTSVTVAPRAGAFAKLDYGTTVGQAAMVHALRSDGKPLPFGATVFDEKGETIGVVGQGSKAFIRGALDGATITVKWGAESTQQCRIALPADASKQQVKGAYRSIEGRCLDGGAVSMTPAVGNVDEVVAESAATDRPSLDARTFTSRSDVSAPKSETAAQRSDAATAATSVAPSDATRPTDNRAAPSTATYVSEGLQIFPDAANDSGSQTRDVTLPDNSAAHAIHANYVVGSAADAAPVSNASAAKPVSAPSAEASDDHMQLELGILKNALGG